MPLHSGLTHYFKYGQVGYRVRLTGEEQAERSFWERNYRLFWRDSWSSGNASAHL